jgi:uncharacterized protein
MRVVHGVKMALAGAVATLVICVPVMADEIKGQIKSIDRASQSMVVHDEKSQTDITVSLSALGKMQGLGKSKNVDMRDLKPGSRVVVDNAFVAARIAPAETESTAPPPTLLEEFWDNFKHNLFKPLLLFFYLGFLVPILKVQFEFPYVMYQALTIYLLLAIGWHGGEELAKMDSSIAKTVFGFVCVGFVTNFFIGIAAYLALRALPRMRQIDQATVAGYYGSDSAGTFVTCLGVLGTAHIAFDAYMPVMLAVMEIPGCLVALYLVSRLRHQGMDANGNMPDEPGYDPAATPLSPNVGTPNGHGTAKHEKGVQAEAEMSLEKMEHPNMNGFNGNGKKNASIFSAKLLHEVFLNTGLYLLFGGILIGYISGMQGEKVTREDDHFFVSLFQGVLCLFLLEMGMTASRKLKDLKTGGLGYILFALVAPNIFATCGMLIMHVFAYLTGTHFQLGSYVLFAVLCGAASYIAVPAVQRLAIPEASPTLPLAASLGLTFSYNVTIGIPVYIMIGTMITRQVPIA